MTTAYGIAPIINNQQLTNNGAVNAGGSIYIYYAGTTTVAQVFGNDYNGAVLSNPLTLNSAGRLPSNEIYLLASNTQYYDFVIKDSAGVTLDTISNVRIGSADNIVWGSGTLRDYLTNLSAANLTFTKSNTSTTRALSSKLEDLSFSVKDIGATGNGTTDDSTAIQNAINYCVTYGYKTLYFPKGTYKISTQLFVNSTTLTLEGETGSTLYFTSTTTGHSMIYATASTLGVKNLRLEAQNGSNYSQNAIRFAGGTYPLVVTDCYIYTWGSGINQDGLSTDSYIARNTFISTTAAINITGSTYAMVIEANTFTGIAATPSILIGNSNNPTIESIIIRDNSFKTGGGSSDTTGHISLYCGNGIIISSNMFVAVNTGSPNWTTPTGVAIVGTAVNTVKNVQILNNIYRYQRLGVFVQGAVTVTTTNIYMSGNVFESCVWGVKLTTAYISNLTLKDNTFSTITTANIVNTSTGTNILLYTNDTQFQLKNTSLRSNVTGNGTTYIIPYNSVIVSNNSTYTGGAEGSTVASGVITIQTAGIYRFVASVSAYTAGTNASQITLSITKNGVAQNSAYQSGASGSVVWQGQVEAIFRCAAGDTIRGTFTALGSGADNWVINSTGTDFNGAMIIG